MLHLVGLMVQAFLILLIVCTILFGVAFLLRLSADAYSRYETRRLQKRAYDVLQKRLETHRRRDYARKDAATSNQIFKNVEEYRNDFE